jgi:hypothetical protein
MRGRICSRASVTQAANIPGDMLSESLREVERRAKLPKLAGGLWHPHRRGWASERMHLPLKAVADAGAGKMGPRWCGATNDAHGPCPGVVCSEHQEGVVGVLGCRYRGAGGQRQGQNAHHDQADLDSASGLSGPAEAAYALAQRL